MKLAFVPSLVVVAILCQQLPPTCSANHAERSFVVARKTVVASQEDIRQGLESANAAVEGHNLTVTLSVYNIGSATAHNIMVQDAWRSAEWRLNKNDLNFFLPSLRPGDQAQHQYQVIPRSSSDRVQIERAHVKYGELPEDDEHSLRESFSSTEGFLKIWSQDSFNLAMENHVREWITFALLALGPVIGPFIFLMILRQNSEALLAV